MENYKRRDGENGIYLLGSGGLSAAEQTHRCGGHDGYMSRKKDKPLTEQEQLPEGFQIHPNLQVFPRDIEDEDQDRKVAELEAKLMKEFWEAERVSGFRIKNKDNTERNELLRKMRGVSYKGKEMMMYDLGLNL